MVSSRRPILGGLAYGLLGFALGFAFGVVRTLLVAPAIGAFAAVAVETPLMLAACLPLARWSLRRWQVVGSGEPFTLGLIGFVVLMVCEVLLGLALGENLRGIAAGMARPPGLLGLAGQIVFALLPASLAVPRQ